ncbi:KCNJ9 [Symbiodinium microadriaticum]|nr:KCNJ9 [Symbiodinium microadriaticum]
MLMEMVQPMQSPFDVASEGQVKRFIERGRTVAQSTGRINVRRIRTNHHTWWASFWSDPFHSVIHHSTIKIMAFFCASYLFTHLLFSLVYYMVDESCDLQIKSLLDAMYLSLEVGMTIGWGLPGSPYMKQRGARHGCFSGVGIVYLHTLTMSMQNALMIGLIYCRMSRGTSRAASLVFSEKAVIREIGGKFYFMFQVCESKKHQLVEAKVRCYALCTGLAGDQSPSGMVAIPPSTHATTEQDTGHKTAQGMCTGITKGDRLLAGYAGTAERIHVYMYALVKVVYAQIRLRT